MPFVQFWRNLCINVAFQIAIFVAFFPQQSLQSFERCNFAIFHTPASQGFNDFIGCRNGFSVFFQRQFNGFRKRFLDHRMIRHCFQQVDIIAEIRKQFVGYKWDGSCCAFNIGKDKTYRLFAHAAKLMIPPRFFSSENGITQTCFWNINSISEPWNWGNVALLPIACKQEPIRSCQWKCE